MKQKIKYSLFKRTMCVALAFFMLFSVVKSDAYTLVAEAKVPKSGSGFGTLSYEDWCQKMSTYKGVRKSGCRVTAYTKLIYEAGYTQVKNPDVFFKWGVSKKYFKESSAYEKVSFGNPMINYIKTQGGSASLKKKISIKNMKKATVADTIMQYIEDGYYCILSCSAHTVYVGREASLNAGTPMILDSSFGSSKKWTGTYGNIIKYTDYTANKFTNLRVFKVSSSESKSETKAEAKTYKITLNKQNGSSKQYIYEKYGTGFYSNSKCKTSITTVKVPTKSGYTFAGYYTAKNGKGKQYINASGKITAGKKTFKKNTTLYAYWKEKNPVYKITLDLKNGGEEQYIYLKYGVGLFSDSTCKTPITTVSVPNKDGYTFMGYYTQEDGLGAQKILASGEVAIHKNSLNQNLTLYAYWEKSAAVYKITLKPQNGGADQYIYEKYGVGFFCDSACTKPITSIDIPLKQDWIFNGYWTENTDAGFRYINESGRILADNTAVKSDITLYGLWTKNTSVYKITLDSQKGTAYDISDIYVKYGVWFCRFQNGSSQIEKLRVTEREGYTYGGYYTGKNGTGIKCVDENGYFVVSTTAFTADTTWYGYWIPD